MKLKPIAANQTEVQLRNALVFFSYETPVAVIVDGMAFRTEHKWSRTTSKHIGQFMARHGFTEARQVPQETIEKMANVR